MITQAKCLSQEGCDSSCDSGGDVPEVRTIGDPDPCAAAGCAMQGEPVEVCRDHRCPHRREREAAEYRAGREERQKLSHRRNGNER